jgi:hypothetical protein
VREVLDGTTLADMVRERRQQGVFHGIYKPLPTTGSPLPTGSGS